MAATGSTAGADAAPQTGSARLVGIIDENLLVEWGVLGAAQAATRLGPLASSCKKLCSLVRKGTAYLLHVRNSDEAAQLVHSHMSGRPFTGCTQLCLEAADGPSRYLAVCVLDWAQTWTALQQLQLSVPAILQQQQQQQDLVPYILSNMAALSDLRRLDLLVPHFEASSAGCVGMLSQLTRLQIAVNDAAAEAPADLSAVSGLRSLKELSLEWPPAVQPAAGLQGSCLPSSLTYIGMSQDVLQETGKPHAAPMACWLTHIPACRQLRDLYLNLNAAGGQQQHASAHPSAVVAMLAQHTPQLTSLEVWGSADWGAVVAGLPDTGRPAEAAWHPDRHLAALKQLQHLRGFPMLCVSTQEQWQALMQLSRLTELGLCTIKAAPQQGVGAMVALVEILDCSVTLGGRELGLVLLACPVLQRAAVELSAPGMAVSGSLEASPLPQHPSLQWVRLSYGTRKVWHMTLLQCRV
jgi:hypothetical protein